MCYKEVNPSNTAVAVVYVPEANKSINEEIDIAGKTSHVLQSDTIGEDGGRSKENRDASLVTPNTMFRRSGCESRLVLVDGDDVFAVCLYPLSQIGIKLRLYRLQVAKAI
jgi:hypothetical protein